MAFHDQINRLYNGQKVPQDRVVSEQCEAGEFYLTQGKVFAFRISFMKESIRGTRFLGPLDSDLWRSYDFENRMCASITEAQGFICHFIHWNQTGSKSNLEDYGD